MKNTKTKLRGVKKFNGSMHDAKEKTNETEAGDGALESSAMQRDHSV